MANEYTTITVDMARIDSTAPNGTLYAELSHVVTLANGNVVYPEKRKFAVTAGAAAIQLACTSTAIKNQNATYSISFAPTGQQEKPLGRILPTASASPLDLADLLEVGATSLVVNRVVVAASNIVVFESIAALQAATGRGNRDLAFVLGVGWFRCAGNTGEAAVGNLIVADASGLEWYLETPSVLAYRQVHDIRMYGASAALADNATYIQAAIDAAEVACGVVYIPDGTFDIAAGLVVGASGVTIVGAGGKSIIRAKAAVNFETMILATSMSNLTFRDFVLDGNQANRAAQLTTRTQGLALTSCTDCFVEGVVSKNHIGTASVPGVCFGVGGGAAARVKFVGCTALDSGIAGKASDGFFTSGTQILIVGCTASNCLDTGFVIETSQQSGIAACTATGCGAGAAITNASASAAYGNFIDGLTVNDWSATVTGGIQIGNPDSVTTGDLIDTLVTGVVVRNVSGAGPAINVRKTGTAKTVGLILSNIIVDGAGTQGILLDAEDVTLTGCKITSTGTPIQVADGSARIFIRGNQIAAVSNLAVSLGANIAVAEITDNYIKGDGATTTYGIFCGANCTGIRTPGNTIDGVTIARIGADATTAPRASSDITYMDAVPTLAGEGIYPYGHTIIITSPVLGGPAGYRVTTAGVPGGAAVFSPFGWMKKRVEYTGATAALGDNENIAEINRAGAVTVTLPASTYKGDEVVVKDVSGNASANNITLAAGSGTTLEAADTINTDLGYRVYYLSGAVWRKKAAG